jgi:sugar lactone lactonase YvrE
MRLKQVSLAAAISVVAGLTTATVGLTGPAAWADGGSAAALPLSHYAHMVVDGAHQHLFFSQGAGTTGIVVTDLSGNPVTTIDGEQGADGLALSADGKTLYAALTDGDAIAAIDTATLAETGRFGTGTASAPVSVAQAGGKVWYSYTADDGKGTVGSLDPSAADPAPTPQPVMPHWSAAPLLSTGGGVLAVNAAQDAHSSMTHIATYDVSSGTPSLKVDMGLGGAATGPVQVTPDGTKLLVPQSTAVYVYSTADLSTAKPYVYYTGGVGSSPDSVAIDSDGTIALGSIAGSGAGAYLYAADQIAENHVAFPAGTVAAGGLVWGADGRTLYAVTQDNGSYALDVLGDAKLTDTTLSLNAPSPYAIPAQRFTVNGTVGGHGFVPDGATLKVTRDGTDLPDATVGADGSFGITDTRQDEGGYTYEVSYAGDATHRPATTSLKVWVSRVGTSIPYPEFSSATPHKVAFTGTVMTDLTRGPFTQGDTVQVTRTNEDTHQSTQLPAAPLDPATGRFTVADDPGTAGWFTYRLSFGGDITHQPDSNDVSTTISPYAPALTLKAPATATRGAALSFGAVLGDGPYDRGETVTVTRTDAAHTTTPVTWTAPVAADGTITVKDAPSIGGANAYTVSYAGDTNHRAATASATVQVSRATTSLSVTANASTYAYGATATVTAHLGTTYNGRTVSLYATPAGGKKTLVKTGTVDSKGNLTATYKLVSNTTFTASYTGDYRYAPATATRAVSDQVKIAQALSGYYTTTTYSGTTYRVYHHTVQPTVTTTVTPNKSGQCVHFQVQQYYSGAWHTLSTSGCFTLGSKSAVAAQLSLSHAVNQKFRVRSEYVHSSKDTTNVSTWGGWQYLTVRT